jgi:cytochrome c-type biogenesis protein CcmH/NrfG
MARLSKPIEEKLFNEQEMEAIRREAEEAVLKDQKAKAKKALLEEAKREARSKIDPEEEIIEVVITLPRFAPFIAIDGTQYHHGNTYKVPRKQYNTICDIMAQSWRHEEAAFGERDPNAYQVKRGGVVGRGTSLNMSNHFLRV